MNIRKLFVFASAASLVFLISCGKEEEETTPTAQKNQPAGINTIQEGDRTVSTPDDTMSSLIAKKNFEKIREDICGKNGCSDELQTYKDKITFNTLVVFTNVMILFKRLDGALNTLCGVLGEQLGSICETSAPILSQSPRISPGQTDVIDTLLNLVGLKRDEITTLMEEVIQASQNYNSIQDNKNYVFRLTAPLNVKIGALVDVWFKAGTEIRYDLMAILGSVSQGVAALFNIINSHNWELDISGVLSNASQLLDDLEADPAGLVRRLPQTLGLDTAPNFMRFVSGKENLWKNVPTNVSTLMNWASSGLDYFFKNPCAQNDPALVCWSGSQLKFNLDTSKKNIFLGEDAEGTLDLPEGFSDKTAEEIVKILSSGSQKFDCSKDDNWIKVVGADDEFDVLKIVNAVLSIAEGEITTTDLPNFARFNFCQFFGVEGADPKPARDLILPAEIRWDEQKKRYEIVQSGPLFAFEAEGTRNFYVKALTLGNTSANPLYFQDVTLGSYYLFSLTVNSDYSGEATKFYVSPDGSIVYFPNNLTKNITYYYIIDPDNFISLWFNHGAFLPETIAVIVKQRHIHGDYVYRGDWNTFINVYSGEFTKRIRRDYFEPVTTFLSLLPPAAYSNYPADVFSLEGGFSEIIDQFGLKVIPYVLMKETSNDGKILNGAVEIDNCVVIWEFTERVTKKYSQYNNQLTDLIFLLLINPFIVERAWGKDYLSIFPPSNPVDLPSSVSYLQDPQDQQNPRCGLAAGGRYGLIDHDSIQATPAIPSGWNQESKNWKFVPATNQILNDLIGVGLFAIVADEKL
ncbi:MAG: hypothetical protein NZ927_08785 [Candidatus Calescibacterium sp.]|nr:hypothetical protein [Candidatus Calescibacterium sp.]